ncbi:MAG: vWA domain-containing protein [Hyphomicrobium sp.]
MPPAPRLFTALLAAFALMPSARAADAPSTMLVIDGSGSMWGRLEPDRRAKIDHVRDLLTATLAAAPAARVGVASYGHRRRGDCSDAEVIAGLAAPRETATDALAQLNPRGKGPLVAGLTAALADVGPTRPASLIVITDGADNCQQDACAAAVGFAASAPGVPIHMVTVGVDPTDAPRLACIAKATGGTLFEARDPETLATAIDAAVKLARLTPDTAAAAPETANITGRSTLKATLTLADGSGALAYPAQWRLFKSGSTTPLAETESAELTVRLEPGAYDIEAEAGGIKSRESVEINASEQKVATLALDAARLTVKAANAKGGAASPTATVSIAKDGDAAGAANQILVAHRGEVDIILPPATYKLAIADDAITRNETVELAAGDAKTLDVVLDAGRLELSATGADGAPLDDVAYAISADDPESADGRREVARSRAPMSDFTLGAGTYYVEAISGAGVVRERVAVSAGETVTRTLSMPLVPVNISSQIAGAPANGEQGLVTRIAKLDDDQREVVRSLRPVLETALLPGRYRITARLDAHHIAAEREVLIEAGKPATFVLDIAAAEVQFKAASSAGDAYWEISDDKGKPVWRTQLGEPKTLLQPGRYSVRYEQRERRLEAAFELKAGERRTIELGANGP